MVKILNPNMKQKRTYLYVQNNIYKRKNKKP